MHEPPRVILPWIDEPPSELDITDQEYRYLARVLRIRPGEEVVVLNGKGGIWRGRVEAITGSSVRVVELSRIREQRESPFRIVLLQGVLKGERMDFLIQKTTELGVYELYPVVTEYCQVRHTRRLEHWRSVAREATRQCRRSIVPIIHEVMGLQEAMKETAHIGLRFIFHESADPGGLRSEGPRDGCCILVGPEGGFSPEELKIASEQGFRLVGLGPRVLRAETAGVVATALLQYLYGDLNPGLPRP